MPTHTHTHPEEPPSLAAVKPQTKLSANFLTCLQNSTNPLPSVRSGTAKKDIKTSDFTSEDKKKESKKKSGSKSPLIAGLGSRGALRPSLAEFSVT